MIINKLSPVRRLSKSYGNQEVDGEHMCDLMDRETGRLIAKCIYIPYADEIIAAVENACAHDPR